MEVSNIEKFKIVNKQWAKAHDVIALVGCGKTKAYQIIDEVLMQEIEAGYRMVQRATVPMTELIAYLNIDKNAIYQAALQEKELYDFEFNREGGDGRDR